MANYAVPEENLTAIADAIRLKSGSAAPITIEDMPLAISLIDGGGGGGLEPYQTIDVEVPADMLGSGVVDFKAPINEGITLVVLRNKKEFPREKEFIIATKTIYLSTTYAYSDGINLTGNKFNNTSAAVITIPIINVSTKIANMRLSSNANNYIYAGLYTLEFYQL